VAQFGTKLKEELSKEKDQFLIDYEADEQQALAEYGYTEITIGGVLDLLVEQDNKDAVEELVTQFVEKIESEVSNKDTAMKKGWQSEWNKIMLDIQEGQHIRGRNIINEIIQTADNFTNAVGKYRNKGTLSLAHRAFSLCSQEI